MPQTLSQLSRDHIKQKLQGDGLTFFAGRFAVRLRSKIPWLIDDLRILYCDSAVTDELDFLFDIQLAKSQGLRGWIKPQVYLIINGLQPFNALPYEQATPMLEWGLNWCVSQNYHSVAVVHAAVLEKNDKTIVLPGQPGAGKSTLCAELTARQNCRLLSDELTLVTLDEGDVEPNPRPVSLKNQSVSIIQKRYPHWSCTSLVKDTQKGSVSLFCPPASSIASLKRNAKPGLVIFPQYNGDAENALLPIGRGEALMELLNQCFNLRILKKDAFAALSQHIKQADCYRLHYSGDLTSACELIEDLADDLP